MSLLENLEESAVLIKQDGKEIIIKAEFQQDIIFINDTKTPVEIGDIILETLPNGTTKRLIVTDVRYIKGSMLLSECLELSYTTEARKHTVAPSFQINGNINANRLYFNSTDNSTNIDIDNNQAKFDELLDVLKQEKDVNSELLSLVEDMRKSVGKPTFKDSYTKFMANAANHMTVIAPFISWLSSLL